MFPTPNQIRDDLHLLQRHFGHLHLHDCSQHALPVLQVIQQDGLPFEVMRGAYLGAEANNPGCPCGGTDTDTDTDTDTALQASMQANADALLRLVGLAGCLSEIATSAALGNKATVGPHDAAADRQAACSQALHTWAQQAGVRLCLFAAFDAALKGPDHPLEPEKHGGLFTADRLPKPVLPALFGVRGLGFDLRLD